MPSPPASVRNWLDLKGLQVNPTLRGYLGNTSALDRSERSDDTTFVAYSVVKRCSPLAFRHGIDFAT